VRLVVLDSSAVLAMLLREPGADAVAAALPDARLCSVNLVEVVTRLIDLGSSQEAIDAAVAPLRDRTLDFTSDLAVEAARLRPLTRERGLSLGDRACLALARQLGAAALTADRAWAGLEVGVRIELIR
jgi:PIN domain nuclease of toxin-antitoxin system